MSLTNSSNPFFSLKLTNVEYLPQRKQRDTKLRVIWMQSLRCNKMHHNACRERLASRVSRFTIKNDCPACSLKHCSIRYALTPIMPLYHPSPSGMLIKVLKSNVRSRTHLSFCIPPVDEAADCKTERLIDAFVIQSAKTAKLQKITCR